MSDDKFDDNTAYESDDGKGEYLNNFWQPTFFTPEQQMSVIAHDAVAAKTHIHTFKPLGEDTFKRFKVGTFFEYPQPTIGAVKNMINNSASTFSFGSRHRYGN